MRARIPRLIAAATVAAVAGAALSAPPAQAATVVVAKVNFQPDTAPVPAGSTKDIGAAYDATRGSGWVRQDSAASAAPVPLDLTANTRRRGRAGIDPRLDTLIHLQYGDIPPPRDNGVTTAGAWQYAVPPGTYQVTVSVGDQAPYNSSHVVRVEGATAVNAFVSTAAAEYATRVVTVPVLDGLLTLDAVGGVNTKLNFAEIERVVDDTTPPAAPTAPTATGGDQQIGLTWPAVPGAAGYRVHRNGVAVSGAGLVLGTSYTDIGVTNGVSTAYRVSAFDAAGNESALSPATSASAGAFSLQVDFTDQATPAATGYTADVGAAFDATRGYGWVDLTTGAPLNLTGNGRNRVPPAVEPDVRLATLVHAQLPAGSAGVTTPGRWEAAVPNGSYTVSVAVGDAGGATNSVHAIDVEDQSAIAGFVPVAGTAYATGTVTATVTDGRLTISPKAGTNTKYLYATVVSVPASAGTPAVRTITPANRATGADPASTSVVADLRLLGSAVDQSTLSSTSVTLTRDSDGTAVPANVITSGGDVVNLSPQVPLQPSTRYRFVLTAAVKDAAGRAFQPFQSVFTTGSGGLAGPVAFDKVVGVATGASFTTVVKGPDGRLYAGTLDGRIFRYPINADGTLGTATVIETVRTHATTAALPGGPDRTVIGMAFDPASTAANPILWISDNYEYAGTPDVPDWSSKIAKLTGPDLSVYTEVVTDLPRSVKDHETNSLAFNPADGALYLSQGANNAMGAPDGQWGDRAEHTLSAAILRLDPARLPATLPLNVRTSDGGSYNPYAAGAALTIHATGVRNAYDLVWHRNGHLYTPTNGSAASGNTPATPSPLPASCANRPGGAYTGPAVPPITNNPQAETDYVFDVKPGRYYGHPNPSRCEWVLAGANPTAGPDPFQVDAYPVGTPTDPNLDLAGIYDAGTHASANGVVEYRGGALDGKLLVVRYSTGQDIETFDVAPGGALSNRTTGITGFTGFLQPLDIAQDVANGNLYVTELGASRITLLRPAAGTPGRIQAPSRAVFSAVRGTVSAAQPVVVTNTGGSPVTVTGLTVSGAFQLSGAPALPATLAAGGTLSVPVTFNPTVAGPAGGTLAVASSAGTSQVTLRGLGAASLGGSGEPSLQWVLDTWQIPVNVGDPDVTTSSLPTTNPLGPDELGLQTLRKAADDQPVTITPIAAYGAQSTNPAIRFGWHGPAADLHELGTVTSAKAQGLAPADPVTFDPGAGTFGLYSLWPPFGNRVVSTEDSRNTFDAAVPHHVRAYPMRNPDGSTVANTYLVATEETTSGQDYQDFVAIVSNVQPAAGSTGVVALSNLDGVPYPDRLVFSRIGTPANAAQRTHDVATVRIRNTGAGPLRVTGLPVTGAWTLDAPPALPATVAAGGQLDVAVRFTATGTRLHNGSLTVQTDSATTPSTVVQLAGSWQSVSEGGQEPTVRDIAGVFGWTTSIPANLNRNGAVVAQGDEVLSPFWRRANTAAPVTVRQLMAYHTYPNGATVKWFPQGGANVNLFGQDGAYAQSLLPPGSAGSFTPSAAVFGFAVDGESSDNTRNNQSQDQANGCPGPCGHHVVFFPVKDRAGAVVPNTFVMVMDYSGINYDYNDNGYLITNVVPA